MGAAYPQRKTLEPLRHLYNHMTTMAMEISTPPTNPHSPSKRRHSPNMSIDLSDLPPLSQPTPPSNTLLITNLQALEIFTASNLESIQRAINEHAPIHSFAPLKSFRRIVCSFFSIDDAINIRRVLDGETVLGSRIRVYFGAETKIDMEDQHLQAPESSKLFFISPPPSPPMGWEMQRGPTEQRGARGGLGRRAEQAGSEAQRACRAEDRD